MKHLSLILFIAFSLIFTLASCGPEPGPEHECGYGEWQTVEGKEATSAQKMEEISVCTTDPTHTEKRETPMLSHTFEGEYYNDELSHWQMCSVCGERGDSVEHESEGPATTEHAEVCLSCGYEMAPKMHLLDGKRIIFIGDSFVYFGNTVIEKAQSVQKQSLRENDRGYFYQICRANGADVSVTNWTYGGHGLTTHLQQNCTHRTGCNGTCHIEDLTNRYFDIVVLSGGRGSSYKAETFISEIETFIDIFRSVNPDVKFVYLVSSGAHNVSVNESFPKEVLNSLKKIEDDYGFTIVDWGKIVRDVIDGTTVVEGATNTFTKTSFTIAKSKEDGFHPSPLAGYITSLMTYCALTGESAVGQSYDFCSNQTLNLKFNFNKYINDYYKVDTTNFPEIFKSPADMLGIQKLIDQYLAEKAYRNYNYQ